MESNDANNNDNPCLCSLTCTFIVQVCSLTFKFIVQVFKWYKTSILSVLGEILKITNQCSKNKATDDKPLKTVIDCYCSFISNIIVLAILGVNFWCELFRNVFAIFYDDLQIRVSTCIEGVESGQPSCLSRSMSALSEFIRHRHRLCLAKRTQNEEGDDGFEAPYCTLSLWECLASKNR